MPIFPASLREIWNNWELRLTILSSLSIQIVLIALGSRRKYNTKNWITIILWLAYLSADTVATFALGVLSRSQGNSEANSTDPSYVIMASWAPFLLVHLGGPDTITAYSLEDNQLWLRHLLTLVIQVGVVLSVFVRSLKPTGLNFIAIPIFVAGIVKYGERTWILRSASSQHFRESLLPRPDPGPKYANFMEECALKVTEGCIISWSVIPAPKVVAPNYAAGTNSLISDAKILNAAHEFFLTYKRLFADLILSFHDLEKSLSFFQENSWEDAFKVIEVELGFMYDVLYTKATILYSKWGGFLRCTSLSSTAIVVVAFCTIDWREYSKIDVSITFLLLVGAIGLEIYAILLLLSSDWTLLWLSKHKNKMVNLICKFISCFKCIVISKRKWSNSMAQHNFLKSCFEDKPAICCKILKGMCIHKINQGETTVHVSPYLKESIFKQLVDKSHCALDFKSRKKLCSARGDQVLQKMDCLEKLAWNVEEEFDHSILLWHIATDLCYYSDQNEIPNTILDPNCQVSKFLSDYLLYILVKLPNMLPNGIGQIRFQDTCAEAIEFFRERNCK